MRTVGATRTRDRVLRAHLDRLLGLDGHARVGTSGVEAALTDCPNELWQTNLWPDEAPTAPRPHGGLHGSAPWFRGYRD